MVTRSHSQDTPGFQSLQATLTNVKLRHQHYLETLPDVILLHCGLSSTCQPVATVSPLSTASFTHSPGGPQFREAGTWT